LDLSKGRSLSEFGTFQVFKNINRVLRIELWECI
jgi:hypothetical protein